MNRKLTESVTICITGATDGIGQAMARQYHQQGYQGLPVQLILIGRRPLSELDNTFYCESNYCQTDLAESSSARQIVAWMEDQQINSIDMLVHNAGSGYVGLLEEQSADSIDTLIAVNLTAPIAITHKLVPYLQDGARVVFVSSVASSLPSPEYAVYSATKAALDGFARNLRTEFRAPRSPKRLDVKLILPGATKTNMHSKSGADLEALKWDGFPSAESVATKIRRAIEGYRFSSPIGWQNGALRSLSKWGRPIVEQLMARQFAQRYPSSALSAAAAENEGPLPKHAVITGAADGIGKSLAKLLIDQGYAVTGIDLDRERAAAAQAELAEAGGQLEFIFGDLGKSADLARIGKELATAVAQKGHIYLCIHNAGISAVGHFPEIPLEKQRLVLDVNFRAPLLLTATILREGLMKPGGTLIYMASLSYFAGYPGAAVYGASKDGLASFAQSLQAALKSSNINVLTVFPGPTRTAHARRYSPDNAREAKRMSPDELAYRILTAMDDRKSRLVPGVGNQLSAVVGLCFPRGMDFVMRKVIFDKLE